MSLRSAGSPPNARVSESNTVLKGMIWFARYDKDGSNNLCYISNPENAFTVTLLFATFSLVLAPLVNYGTWLAAYIYAGNSTDENMRALAEIYSFTFEVFRTGEFAMPAINIDPTQLGNLATNALEYLADLNASFDPEHFLEGARALLALNMLLSLVKTGIAVVAGLLSAGECLGVLPNIQFSECATWDQGAM